MTHSRPRTFSPSRRRITRSTPCVAGCCGPMLMTSSFASRKGFSGVSRSRFESVVGSVTRFVGGGSSLVDGRSSLVVGSSSLLAALDSQVDLHPFVVLLKNTVVLAQGMSLPAVGQQNALHVRVSIEFDAEHIEDLALQPVGGRPDGNRTRQALAVEDLRFHANAFVARERIKNPDNVELFFTLGIMHGGDVDAIIELLFVAKDLKNLRNQRAVDDHVVLAEIGQGLQARTVSALQ